MLNQNKNHPGAILKSSKPTVTWSCAGERERPTKHEEITMIDSILFEVPKKENIMVAMEIVVVIIVIVIILIVVPIVMIIMVIKVFRGP